mmetsp:Transcript_14628/g.29830  ORF Transcript_14628/g.29830 Transcript_14628/m.29830 type:complete len:190 (-) Transcript_14628:78-647(-)
MDPAIAAEFKRLRDALEAANTRLSDAEARNVAQDARLAAQGEEIQQLKAWKAGLEASTASQLEPVLHFSKRWRLLMVACGLLALELAVKALMDRPEDAFTAERLLWASYSFVVFSNTCLVAAVLGNVRSFGSRAEKSVLILLGLLAGVAFFFPGYALASYEDEGTAARGKELIYLEQFTRSRYHLSSTK